MDDKNGTIIFKVFYLGQCGMGSSGEVTRTIEMRDAQTLDDLQEAIIYQAFLWTDGHQYSFYMDNRPYTRDRSKEYTSMTEADMDGKRPNSSTIRLRDLGLKKGQKFLFLFDYGDDHQFGILVEGFAAMAEDRGYPVILKTKGRAPKQYPPCD